MIRKRWIPLFVAGLLTIGIAEPVCDEEEDTGDDGDNGAENEADDPSGPDDGGEDAGGGDDASGDESGDEGSGDNDTT